MLEVFSCLIIDLLIVLVGAHTGAPYKVICLISESNNIRRDLNESFDLMIVLLSPKNASIAFIFRLTCAVLSSPVSFRIMIPR